MSFPVPKEYDMPDITYNNGNVITLPPALSGDGTAINLSELEKNLILDLFSKAAYLEDADAAYNTLENLWASSPVEHSTEYAVSMEGTVMTLTLNGPESTLITAVDNEVMTATVS